MHSVDDENDDQPRIARWEIEAKKATGDEDVPFKHFWISGNSRIRRMSKRGDLVIQMWRENEKSKKPDDVYRHVPIRLIRQDEKRTWFFVEKRPDAEDSTVRWSQFQRHLKRIGFTRQIGARSIQLVPAKNVDAILGLWRSGRED